MKTVKKIALVGLLFGAVAVPLLYIYGRSLWVPFYVKIHGGRSVGEAVEAIKEKGVTVDVSHFEKIVLLGLKSERILEVMGITPEGNVRRIETFPFTGFSGKLGPKLREGDLQIPEGVYSIEYLNPNSSFHLSIKLDYPNRFDRAMGARDGRQDLGSDIFIHGKSATIGCIPIGDDGIEKVFLMVSEIGIENVEIVVSPYDMRIVTTDMEVEGIDWEAELYATIRRAMEALRL